MFAAMRSNAVVENLTTLRTECAIQLIHLNYKIAFRTSEMVHWEFFNYPKIIVENPNFVLRPGLSDSA